MQSAELDAQRIRGEQARILGNLKRSGVNGRFLSAYYLPKGHPALAFLPAQMLELLYKMNARGSESNCYWASMFALGVVGLPERYMDMPEYESLLAGHFEKRPVPQYHPGDVLRLKRARGGMDTHSVVYLGTLKGDQFTHLVLSKNGPVDGPYLIMNLWDMMNRAYPGSRVEVVYRPLALP